MPFGHCNTGTSDYIKVSQAASSTLTHKLQSQPLQHTERSCLLARDYKALSNCISRVRGPARLLQNSRCAVLQRGLQKGSVCCLFLRSFRFYYKHPWNPDDVMFSDVLRKAHAVCWCVMLSELAAPEIRSVCSARQLLACKVERLNF